MTCPLCNDFGFTFRSGEIEEICACKMDWLQGIGLISDNCVEPKDVATVDRQKAVRVLKDARPITQDIWRDYERKNEYRMGRIRKGKRQG